MKLEKVDIELNSLSQKFKALEDGLILKSGDWLYRFNNDIIEMSISNKKECLSRIWSRYGSINLISFKNMTFEAYKEAAPHWTDVLPEKPVLCWSAGNKKRLVRIIRMLDELIAVSDRDLNYLVDDLAPLTNEEIESFKQ